MKDPMNCTQHNTRFIPATIVYTAGVPAVVEGYNQITVADTGTGIVTVTITDGFARAPVVTATAVAATGVTSNCIIRNVTASTFVVECSDEASTLADPGSIHLLICGFDSADMK